MNKVQQEIINANQSMIAYVRKNMSAEQNAQIADKYILDKMSESEYAAYTAGWLMAKGMDPRSADCTKETNIKYELLRH